MQPTQRGEFPPVCPVEQRMRLARPDRVLEKAALTQPRSGGGVPGKLETPANFKLLSAPGLPAVRRRFAWGTTAKGQAGQKIGGRRDARLR